MGHGIANPNNTPICFRPAPAATGQEVRERDVRRRPSCWFAQSSVCLMGLAMAAGCSGGQSFLTGGPTVGQLKTSLSHLEYENQQLKNSVAKLGRENRSIEDRLVQEQLDNGDLTARLDDARNLLRDGGLDSNPRLGSHRDDDSGTSPRTLPTGQSSRKRRKPPFAVIPGQVEIMAPVQDDDTGVRRRSARDSKSSSRSDADDDLDRHTYRSGTLRWLPVADATDDAITLFR